jgi:hypothetical protein
MRCERAELRGLAGEVERKLAALSSLFEHPCDANAVTHNPVKGGSGRRWRAMRARRQRLGMRRCERFESMITMDSQKLVIFLKYWYILFGELSQWGGCSREGDRLLYNVSSSTKGH